MTTVTIIGAGLIGRSWAIVFARGGCDVRLHDSNASQLLRALHAIEMSLADMTAYASPTISRLCENASRQSNHWPRPSSNCAAGLGHRRK